MTAISARSGRTELRQVAQQLVRDALGGVVERMRLELLRAAASPAAGDGHCATLHLADGSLVAAASPGGRLTRAAPASMLAAYLRARGDAQPGDVFVANDPFVAAVSQLDLYVAAPVHHRGRLLAWVTVMLRQTDLGGLEFGGLTPRARDTFHEGVRLPGLKLADARGRRPDVAELLLASTRVPEAVEADLHALRTAVAVGTRRLAELMATYGPDTVTLVMERLLASSEDQVRARLLELPDGVVRAADFLEHDGVDNWLATVDLVMTKRGDRLHLDFSGSGAQASGFVNATRAGLVGGIAGALASTLGFGIPWNQGLLRPVEVLAPDGLICTARPPAPVGAGASGTVWVVANVVATALNKLLACSPAYLARARAGSSGANGVVAIGGLAGGKRFSVPLADPVAGGGGAWEASDGLDAAGPAGGQAGATPPTAARAPEAPAGASAEAGLDDVETTEQHLPITYLYRRLAAGSGGAGRARGGQGAEAAFTIDGLDAADVLILTNGQEVPNAGGLFGGWPGATVRQRFGHAVLRDQAVEPGALPGRPEAADGGWEELGPKPGRMPMTGTDVVAVSWQGGGGWGDPLERDPDAVWADVRAGAVSRDAARRVYGVLGDGDRADHEATADLRKGMRTERVGQTVVGRGPQREIDGVWPLGGSLRLVRADGQWQVRSSHGALLATGTTAWRAGAIPRPLLPDRRTEGILLHHDLAMTAFFCPESGELLAVDVHRLGAEPIDDIILDLDSVRRLFDREEERRGTTAWDDQLPAPHPLPAPLATHDDPDEGAGAAGAVEVAAAPAAEGGGAEALEAPTGEDLQVDADLGAEGGESAAGAGAAEGVEVAAAPAAEGGEGPARPGDAFGQAAPGEFDPAAGTDADAAAEGLALGQVDEAGAPDAIDADQATVGGAPGEAEALVGPELEPGPAPDPAEGASGSSARLREPSAPDGTGGTPPAGAADEGVDLVPEAPEAALAAEVPAAGARSAEAAADATAPEVSAEPADTGHGAAAVEAGAEAETATGTLDPSAGPDPDAGAGAEIAEGAEPGGEASTGAGTPAAAELGNQAEAGDGPPQAVTQPDHGGDAAVGPLAASEDPDSEPQPGAAAETPAATVEPDDTAPAPAASATEAGADAAAEVPAAPEAESGAAAGAGPEGAAAPGADGSSDTGAEPENAESDGAESDGAGAEGATDAGADAALSAAPEVEGGTDAGTDAALAAAPEVDAGTDMGTDVGTDSDGAGAEGATEAGAAGGPDAGADAALSVAPDADAGTDVGTDSDGAGAGSATGAGADPTIASAFGAGAPAWARDAGAEGEAPEQAVAGSEEPRSAWGAAKGAMSSFGKWLLPPHGPAPEAPEAAVGTHDPAAVVEDPGAEPATVHAPGIGEAEPPLQAPEVGQAEPPPGTAWAAQADTAAGPEGGAALDRATDLGAPGSDTLVEGDQLQAPDQVEPDPGLAEPPATADGALPEGALPEGAPAPPDELDPLPFGAHERVGDAEREAFPIGAHERDPSAPDPFHGAHEALPADASGGEGARAEEGGDAPREDGQSPEP